MRFHHALPGIVLSVLSLGCVLHAPAAAQPADAAIHLDSLFTILEVNDRLMGAVSIRKGQRVVYERAFGHRDSTSAGWVGNDLETRFRIGSVTKPFTAVLVYQLIDAKRFTLDTPIGAYFPGLNGGDKIKVRDLLGHTSGLADYTQGMDPMVALDRAAIIERIASRPAMFEPGTRRRYSNTNYLLLGLIVEDVTGQPYATVLKEGIVDRAGLKHTRFGGEVSPGDNESRAYFFDEGRWIQQPDHVIENAGGAGAIVSTAGDLTRFLSALFGGKLISAASLPEMLDGFSDGTVKSGKGLSPFQIPGADRTGYSHDGSIGAHSALIGYVPDDSLALALTINGHNYPRNRVFFAVWDILYGRTAPLPSFTPVPLDDALAAGLVGSYSAPEWGLKIQIQRVSDGLEARVSADDAFPMTYVGGTRFMYEKAGILIDFAKPEGNVSPRFTLYQQHAAIPLNRDEP
jgi:CubicO group peptidase (beta-lactamase class C family)